MSQVIALAKIVFAIGNTHTDTLENTDTRPHCWMNGGNATLFQGPNDLSQRGALVDRSRNSTTL